MRILNRPMFKYGGPIKEGVMHGMKNGGRAALVGNPVYPQTGGREHHRVNLSWLGIGAKPTAGIAAKPGFIRTQAPKAWEKIKNIFGSTSKHTPVTQVTKPAVTKWSGPYSGTVPGGTTWQGGAVQKVWTPSGWVARDPLYKLGSAAWAGKGVLGKPLKWAGKQIATPTGIGLTLVGTKWLWPDGKPANEKEITEHLNQGGGKSGGVPGGGDEGMTYTDPDKAKKLAKEKQNERLKSYLDMMGYDQAKRGALDKALIDASALVQDATTEAGSIKHADWGKLINKAIQTTSKRLEKPEQIREAVGLMATKAAIEKDMTAEEDALNKIYKEMQIKIGQKTLAGTSFEDIVSDRMIKSDMLKGNDLAALFRIKKGIDAKVISTTDMDADQDALTYVKKIMADKKKEGTPYPPGHYIISDRIVVVDEQGNPSKVL